MALGVRRQSEDCNSTARRNAECTSEPNPQGKISIYNWANSGMQSRDSLHNSPEMHCSISVNIIYFNIYKLVKQYSLKEERKK